MNCEPPKIKKILFILLLVSFLPITYGFDIGFSSDIDQTLLKDCGIREYMFLDDKGNAEGFIELYFSFKEIPYQIKNITLFISPLNKVYLNESNLTNYSIRLYEGISNTDYENRKYDHGMIIEPINEEEGRFISEDEKNKYVRYGFDYEKSNFKENWLYTFWINYTITDFEINIGDFSIFWIKDFFQCGDKNSKTVYKEIIFPKNVLFDLVPDGSSYIIKGDKRWGLSLQGYMDDSYAKQIRYTRLKNLLSIQELKYILKWKVRPEAFDVAWFGIIGAFIGMVLYNLVERLIIFIKRRLSLYQMPINNENILRLDYEHSRDHFFSSLSALLIIAFGILSNLGRLNQIVSIIVFISLLIAFLIGVIIFCYSSRSRSRHYKALKDFYEQQNEFYIARKKKRTKK